MRCKNCGSENDDNLYICQNCGSPLYDESDDPRDIGKTKVVPNLDQNDLDNYNNADNDDLMARRQQRLQKEKQQKEDKKQKQTVALIIVLVIVLIAIISTTIAVVAHSKKQINTQPNTDSNTVSDSISSDTSSSTAYTSSSTSTTTTISTTTTTTSTTSTTKRTTTTTTTKPAKTYDVNLSCNEGGEVESNGKTANDGTYTEGSTVTIIARPDDGYTFDGWYSGNKKVSGSTKFSFKINGNKSYNAVFVPSGDSTDYE